MMEDRLSNISMDRLVRLVAKLPDFELRQLEDALMESIRLVQEKSRPDITPEEKQEIQKKIDELNRQQDDIILGGWGW